MDERRRQPRRRSLLAGRIVYNGITRVMDVRIRNVSDTGVLVEVDPLAYLSGDVQLIMSGSEQRRRARLVWRDGARAGLAFAA